MSQLSKFICMAMLALAPVAFSQCSDDKGGSKNDVPAAVVTLPDEYQSLQWTDKGGQKSITISSNVDLTPETSADWVTVTPATSYTKGVLKFFVECAENTSIENREAEVSFTAADGTTVKITISQSGKADMSLTAKEVIGRIKVGVNIGNTMEATSGETSWGNPQVNATYIAGLKSMGFNAVRIPCAWHSHFSNAETYTIDKEWMDRVKEVVGYCVDNDMYVVLNSHWDTGWLEDNIFDASKESAIVAEQKAIWTQIAKAFNDFDAHLLFAGCNEPGMNETSSGGKSWEKTPSAVSRLVKYEQTFIDAVRATGGNNAQRCLVFQGLGTDISNTSDFMTNLPTDEASDRLIAEIHYYEPYQWALMEEDAGWGKVFWYWGKENHKDGSAHNATWGEESWVESQFAKMKKRFVDNGIPVIVGEFSSRVQTAATRDDKTEEFDEELHKKSRAYFNEVVTRVAKNNGCAPFYWETGSEINRADGTAKNQYAIDGLMKGAEAGVYPW